MQEERLHAEQARVEARAQARRQSFKEERTKRRQILEDITSSFDDDKFEEERMARKQKRLLVRSTKSTV